MNMKLLYDDSATSLISVHTPSGYPFSPMIVLEDFLHDASSKMARLDAALPAMLLSSRHRAAGSCDRMLEVSL